jgi:hypothetical protein
VLELPPCCIASIGIPGLPSIMGIDEGGRANKYDGERAVVWWGGLADWSRLTPDWEGTAIGVCGTRFCQGGGVGLGAFAAARGKWVFDCASEPDRVPSF